MVKYIIIHNKHEGCYDFQYYEDEATKLRLTSITINPPKLFLFDSKEQAQEFFEEYINDIDTIDIRCKKGDEVEHIDYCTCGIIELDEDENPILFYNKKNQVFLMQHGPQVFLPPQELKNDIKNLNLTNKIIRRSKTLSKEQRKRYIELGKYCEECQANDASYSEDEDDINQENTFENKEESKEESKQESKQYSKEESKEEFKEESKEESKEENKKIVKKTVKKIVKKSTNNEKIEKNEK
jgi:hypothetical protein